MLVRAITASRALLTHSAPSLVARNHIAHARRFQSHNSTPGSRTRPTPIHHFGLGLVIGITSYLAIYSCRSTERRPGPPTISQAEQSLLHRFMEIDSEDYSQADKLKQKLNASQEQFPQLFDDSDPGKVDNPALRDRLVESIALPLLLLLKETHESNDGSYVDEAESIRRCYALMNKVEPSGK